MEDPELCQSFVDEQQKNQFLSDAFKYEKCSYCERNFFIGKLRFHLKLCKPDNPMIKSPLKKAKRRSYLSNVVEPNEVNYQQQKQSEVLVRSPQNKFKKCQYCRATFPLSAIQRHSQKCNLKHSKQSVNPEQKIDLKSKTRTDFKKDEKDLLSALPRIGNSAKQHKPTFKKIVSRDSKQLRNDYTVKIREDLSCFKKALQVQQIECPFCNRKFSKQASLRHIPICQKLKTKEIHQIALKKTSKTELFKLSDPIKKNTLFRSKDSFNLSEIAQKSETKSARIFESQKPQKQKINQTSLIIKKKKLKLSKLQEIRTLNSKQKLNMAKNRPQNKQQIGQQKCKIQNLDDMNMTFSKDLNYSIKYKQKIDQTTSYKQQSKLQAQQQLSQSRLVIAEDQSPELINQFLSVALSKKNTMQEVSTLMIKKDYLDQQQMKKMNEETQCLFKLQITLQDQKPQNKSQDQASEQYQQDFD